MRSKPSRESSIEDKGSMRRPYIVILMKPGTLFNVTGFTTMKAAINFADFYWAEMNRSGDAIRVYRINPKDGKGNAVRSYPEEPEGMPQ